MCLMPKRMGDEAVPVGLLDKSARASIKMMARSAVEAPVTMLRVYWMCPVRQR